MRFKSLILTLSVCFSLFLIQARAQNNAAKTGALQRPKLVVGIVVDQMRWDYLYRYYNRFGKNGFKRMLNEGFSCENTFINYLPSYTAVGHTTIFTGSVPAIHGITGNGFVDQLTGKAWYCTEDPLAESVGTNSPDGKMSPRNLLASTITDELRLATNFQSRVIGVSLKDRASILPAGHTGEAYWMEDATGNFITSNYYRLSLPKWVNDFNARNLAASYMSKPWNTLYPINTYTASDADTMSWEGNFPGEKFPVFPHNMKAIYEKQKGSFRQTPFGNSITMELAKAAILGNSLGKGKATDFLTINFASTDYVGHQYGPNSIEVEDTYLRLDQDLASLFGLLDSAVGKGQYLVFLSADHGAAHSIGFMQSKGLPADFWYDNTLADTLNKILEAKFGTAGLVRSISNYQVNFNLGRIDSVKADYTALKAATVSFLQRQPGISFAVDIENIGQSPVPEPLKQMISNSFNFKRSGGVEIVLNPGWFETYSKTGTTHGTWNPYDTHIPLLWYGWHIKKGSSNREINMTDIAATLAAMLHIQMPNGCVGKVIEELKQ
jgi:predicted AlkP superfamily pyrophosphatase or phosphodiesterase